VVFEFQDYELRTWKKGDIEIARFPLPNFSLYRAGDNLGAALMTSRNCLLAIRVEPEDSGFGTDFVKLLMDRAKHFGEPVFRVESVTGLGSTSREIEKNRMRIKHILLELGFSKKDEHWEVPI
jgi:hypothetical protein